MAARCPLCDSRRFGLLNAFLPDQCENVRCPYAALDLYGGSLPEGCRRQSDCPEELLREQSKMKFYIPGLTGLPMPRPLSTSTC
jgi:hypothetical protein